MKIEQWPTDKPKPYDKNPRINDEAVAKVAASIKAYGFRQPIVVDQAGVIVVGHTRLKAAISLGIKKVAVHVADLTPEQARAYRLDDNRTAEEAEWDTEELYQELIAMQDDGFDLTSLAFDEEELNQLLGDVEEESEPDEPAMPEVYQVVAECNDEEQQQRVYDWLEKEGIKCRVLTL